MALERERETYARHQVRLRETAPGKFVLIHQDQLDGLFDTREDAEHLGGIKFGGEAYLVEQVPAHEISFGPPEDGLSAGEDRMETAGEGAGTALEGDNASPEPRENLDREPAAPSILPPDYERVKRRLDSFERIREEDRREAWEWLTAWRRHLQEGFGSRLPAPWVFAGDSGLIELSWELTHCSLTLRMTPGGPFGYTKGEPSPETDVEESGTVEIREVPELLLWLVGR